MFISQVFKYKHEFWRYLLGSAIIFMGVMLGQIPITAALFFSIDLKELANMDESEMLAQLDPNLSLFLMLLVFAVGLVFILGVARFLHNQPIRALTTSRPKIDWSRFWFAFILVGCVLLVLTLADYFMNPQDYVLNFQPIPFLILLVIAVIFIPLQTSCEEYLFRAYLMQGIGVMARNKWLPLIITSVIFGGLHFFNPEVEKMGNIIMVYYIGTGFMLGILALMDEGIELALGFHAANNLITALLVTADWTAFQTYSIFKDISEPTAGLDILLPVLVIYPIFLFIFAKKYKWNNWKERLFGKVEEPAELKVSEEF
ncbi:type II CAAX endopeptidase family protein [Gramella sp. AN32]|uniref:CPBP family intramembrane glutamic endopeptidase n=1 Tax=Christiangramia antarctica TaxID=2058158 RepID=A0ABW5X6V8_9FLAO|nr:type II CAAX endopeptidase family protein [Gramella sp. AN32]MCM4154584.1 CPBP family intramembrane metalloprotease domain-containing protein [Gramella sp. AN32]